MRTIITDEINLDFLNLKEDDIIVSNCHHCIGCFSCWLKFKYKCIFNDKTKENGTQMLNSDQIIIISKNQNGSYSSTVKRVLERSISFVKPHFKLRRGMIHHQLRSSNIIPCYIFIYGKEETYEKETIDKLIYANNLNFVNWFPLIYHIKDIKEVKKYI